MNEMKVKIYEWKPMYKFMNDVLQCVKVIVSNRKLTIAIETNRGKWGWGGGEISNEY